MIVRRWSLLWMTMGVCLPAVGLMASCSHSKNAASAPAPVSSVSTNPAAGPPFIYVYGEFVSPGRYPWTNGMTLKDSFAVAGGFTDFARHRVTLMHADGSHEYFRWSTKQPLERDPILLPGDKIVNPKE